MGEVRWVNRLREWREAAKMSVKEAASRLGLSVYIYRRCELGEIDPPATALLKIPEVFGVPKREVMELAEPAKAR